MSEPRNHHYVPKTYLKYFSESKKSVFKIGFVRRTGSKGISNIDNHAAERDFYRVPNLGDELAWERFYSDTIEPMINPTFEQVICKCNSVMNGIRILDPKLKVNLAMIMYFQLFRTSKARDFFYGIFDRELIKGENSIRKNELIMSIDAHAIDRVIDYYRSSDQQFKEIIMMQLLSDSYIKDRVGFLLSKSWLIFKICNQSSGQFYTSDNPVAYYNWLTKATGFHGNGLGVKETVIFFPITPFIMIGLYDKDFLLGYVGNYDSKLTLLKGDEFVSKVNRIQKEQALSAYYFHPSQYPNET